MRLPFTTKSVAAKTISQMVGGVDYFVIGIALLIFGYGIYGLVISDLDPRLEGGEEQHTNNLGEQPTKPEEQSVQCDCFGPDCCGIQKDHRLRGEQRH